MEIVTGNTWLEVSPGAGSWKVAFVEVTMAVTSGVTSAVFGSMMKFATVTGRRQFCGLENRT